VAFIHHIHKNEWVCVFSFVAQKQPPAVTRDLSFPQRLIRFSLYFSLFLFAFPARLFPFSLSFRFSFSETEEEFIRADAGLFRFLPLIIRKRKGNKVFYWEEGARKAYTAFSLCIFFLNTHFSPFPLHFLPFFPLHFAFSFSEH